MRRRDWAGTVFVGCLIALAALVNNQAASWIFGTGALVSAGIVVMDVRQDRRRPKVERRIRLTSGNYSTPDPGKMKWAFHITQGSNAVILDCAKAVYDLPPRLICKVEDTAGNQWTGHLHVTERRASCNYPNDFENADPETGRHAVAWFQELKPDDQGQRRVQYMTYPDWLDFTIEVEPLE